MPNSKKKLIMLALFLLVFSFWAESCQAQRIDLKYPPVPGAEAPHIFMNKIKAGEYERNQALPLYLKYVYHLLITLTGIACLVSVSWGGFTYLTSTVRGDAPTTKKALDRITLSVIGIVITLSSYMILNTLNPELLTFYLEKDALPEVEMPEVEKPEYDYTHQFAEVPWAGLIQQTREWSEILRKEATDVWRITSIKGEQGIATIDETSMCLSVLLAACDCGAADDCEEGEDAERCTTGCDVNDSQSCEPGDDSPCPDVDPCNFKRIEGTCSTGDENCIGGCVPPGCIPTSKLCDISAYPEDKKEELTFGGQTLDDSAALGNLPDNLRDAINQMEGQVEELERRARIEIAELRWARSQLQVAVHNQALAEALIRSSFGIYNEQGWAGIEGKKTEEMWPYYEPQAPNFFASPSGDKPTLPQCQGQCPGEALPSCELCGDELLCYGNDYRCCATDPIVTEMSNCRCGVPGFNSSCSGHTNEFSCIDPPPVHQQPIGHDEYEPGTCCEYRGFGACEGDNPAYRCCSPRQCDRNVWKDADKFNQNTLLYNGQTFEIPANGVHFFGPNGVGCGAID